MTCKMQMEERAVRRTFSVQRAVRAGGAVFAQSARAVAALGDGRMAGTKLESLA